MSHVQFAQFPSCRVLKPFRVNKVQSECFVGYILPSLYKPVEVVLICADTELPFSPCFTHWLQWAYRCRLLLICTNNLI